MAARNVARGLVGGLSLIGAAALSVPLLLRRRLSWYGVRRVMTDLWRDLRDSYRLGRPARIVDRLETLRQSRQGLDAALALWSDVRDITEGRRKGLSDLPFSESEQEAYDQNLEEMRNLRREDMASITAQERRQDEEARRENRVILLKQRIKLDAEYLAKARHLPEHESRKHVARLEKQCADNLDHLRYLGVSSDELERLGQMIRDARR